MSDFSTAIVLEKVTIAWMSVAAAVGLVAGVIARSVALTGFGLDSMVEMMCAVVLIQRLKLGVEADAASCEKQERRAALIVGILLLAAAAYISGDAVLHLIRHRNAEESAWGIVLTLLTVPIVMPLANAKLRIAKRIASRALRADAIGNVVCWYLAAVVLVSLTAQTFLHIWWLDAAASLLIVGLLVFEGAQAVRGAKI